MMKAMKWIQDISSNFEKEAASRYLNNVAHSKMKRLEGEQNYELTSHCNVQPFLFLRISPVEQENWRKKLWNSAKRKSSSQQTHFFDFMVG